MLRTLSLVEWEIRSVFSCTAAFCVCQFLAAEIRALHCSYGVGDGESYKRTLKFLEDCERHTLRRLVRRSAKHHAEMTVIMRREFSYGL